MSNVLNVDAIQKIARKVILQKHVQGAYGIVAVAGLVVMSYKIQEAAGGLPLRVI